MTTSFSSKAENSADLVLYEKYLEDQKNIKRNEMI
jgi:hypothetical protein